ncbi:hypothetical protein [Hymenobacter sp. UYP22]|uniref:hypothetical protein n=1 Tax=Hymenobacter sp. UYP22 TaxID=3156348 RepID=UPI003396A4CD
MSTTSPHPEFPGSASYKPWAYILLALLVCISIATVFLTRNSYDSSDSIMHYLFAHYAFQHPINFLESWSKPLVVQLAALPARAGLRGLMVLQCVLVAVATAAAYNAASSLRMPWPWLTIVFCYASPDYFRIQFSGLTEPTFSAVLMVAVALALRGRVAWGAAIISFLPFARSEGFLLLAVYGFYVLVTHNWRALPWLTLGFIVYGIAGVFVYDDFWWVFTRNAYPVRNELYGNGGWLHFIRSLPDTIGWVQYGLFWLGGGRMLWEWLQPTARLYSEKFTADLLLVYGCVVVFIGAHTVFWVFGIFGSFGLTRVLCSVVPLLSLIVLRGLGLVTSLGRTGTARKQIMATLVLGIVGFVFSGARAALRWERDFGQPSDQILANTAARWILGKQVPHVVYSHPYFSLALGTNPFGNYTNKIEDLRDPDRWMPTGTLIFWDEWYGGMEGQTSFESLHTNPTYQLRWQGALPRNRHKPTPDSVRMAIFEKIR